MLQRVLLPVFLISLLAGCSSIQVSQDYDKQVDFSSYHSYLWLPEEDQVKPGAAQLQAQNRLVSQRIETAITRVLAEKGFQPSSNQNTDFYVTYHLELKDKVASRPMQTTFGFGRYGYYSGAMIEFGQPDIYQYEEGQLAIDILNADKQLVWRGISRSALDGNLSPEKLTQLINEAVEKNLAQFPPKTQH